MAFAMKLLRLLPAIEFASGQAKLKFSELFEQVFYDLFVVSLREGMYAAQRQLIVEDGRHHGFNAHDFSLKKLIVIKTIESRRRILGVRNLRRITAMADLCSANTAWLDDRSDLARFDN
ncbi:hypothetical protein ACFQZO_32855 [Bradyrhizobium sp. GCM10027634]|uniref:hypothetical protein n=1 Tax=unclassified Bradyrhizobium TaxID=2631580 RepID=UPI00188DAE92|nr:MULTISPECIES: hypothetical protein [unclassified Bradyrhizobium]MDN5005647.1 hypothetical protein [Bradyrhizobium sp. WYCCWR 12677]